MLLWPFVTSTEPVVPFSAFDRDCCVFPCLQQRFLLFDKAWCSFNRACYLINRMSSSVLKNKIPYSTLYPVIYLFPLPLKIFEYLYFVHNHNFHKTKLDFKCLKEIFLGYSRTQKCYTCFCPSIDWYILSADVTFFESKPKIFILLLLLYQRMTLITYSIGRRYSIIVSPHLKMWLVKIHFSFRIHFKPIHD